MKINETLFCPYSIFVNKCSGSCSDTNNFDATLCVPDVVRIMNIKVFNHISRINETKCVSWHESYAWNCKLDESVCSNKQHWNNDKSRYECKEFINKGECDEEFI